jgi:hypothetical protein
MPHTCQVGDRVRSVGGVGVRAGFWRRSLALIDGIIISLPFQVVVAILFAATSGRIQQEVGLTYTNCSIRQTVPDGLAPPPPAGSNFARECNVYFFGAQTARTLEVGRVTKEGAITKTVSRYYMLDRHGRPIDGVSADGIVMMAFIAYLLATEARTGAGIRMGHFSHCSDHQETRSTLRQDCRNRCRACRDES